MTKIKTVRERTSKPSQLAGIVAVAVPPLGLVIAVWLLWNRGVHPVDLVLLAAFYAACGLGITVGFHRLFTHKSFETSAPLRAMWAILGCMAMQGPVTQWVTDHRKHHALSDRPGDPHSPHAGHGDSLAEHVLGLWHSHIGWLFSTKGLERGVEYGRDLYEDTLVRRVDRLYLLWVALTLVLPFLAGYLVGGSWQRGLEALVWAGLVRIFLFQHVTFSINSICHFFGEQPFRTRDESRNVWLLAIPSFGESWHNGHHAFPASAIHGLEPGQLDISALVIRGMEKLRLATEVKRPDSQQLERRRVVAEWPVVIRSDERKDRVDEPALPVPVSRRQAMDPARNVAKPEFVSQFRGCRRPGCVVGHRHPRPASSLLCAEEEPVAGGVPDERPVFGLVRPLSCLLDAPQDPLALVVAREHDRRVPERGGRGGRRPGAGALPGVSADVVVVAPCAEKGRSGPQLGHQRETEHVAVELNGLRYVRDLQVHVSHHGVRREPVERLRFGIGELAEEIVDVEREGGHLRGDLTFPLFARPVPVDLDPVPVGIGEIERLADEVVREPDQRHAVARGVRKPAGEIRALRHEKREMVEAGVSHTRACSDLLDENEQHAPIATERNAAITVIDRLKPHSVSIVRERALEIGDRQVDRAKTRQRRQLRI